MTPKQPRKRGGSRVRFTIGPVSDRPITGPPPAGRTFHTRDHEEHIDMILNDGQQVALTATLTSRAGNPVPVANAGRLSWTSSDPSVVTVVDGGDGRALVVTTGALGAATVTLRNDFNDDGTDDFQGSLAFDVVAGDVGGIAIAAGEPTSRFLDEVPTPPPAPEPEPLPDPVPETPDTTPDDQFPSPGDGGEGEAPLPDPGNPDVNFPPAP